MANFKFVKSATAAVLGASVLTTAVVVPGADASAKTTYKVNKYGYLVNAKTNKKVNGYKTYKGKLYKNGKKFTGKTSSGVYYVKGKKFTGKTKYGYYYVNGKRFTGTTKYGYYYVNGKRFNGKTKYGNLYVDGKRYTGTTKYGYTYYNGKRVEGEYKGKVYTNGKLVTGLYKEKLYNKGVLETGLDLYKDKLYKDGVLNVGYALYNEDLYKDAAKNEGFVADPLKDGKAYNDTKLANGTFDVDGVEKAYEDGVEVGAKVKSVEAINGTQLKVTFNKSIDESTVVGTSDALQNITVAKVGATAATGLKAELSDDKKSLTISSSTVLNGEYNVSVSDSVKTTAGDKVEASTKLIKVEDKVAPTYVGFTKENASTFVFNFSEPINDKGSIVFKNADGTTLSVPSSNITVDGSSIKVVLPASVEAGKDITVSFAGLTDFATNILETPFSVTIQKGAKDGVAPEVTSVTPVNAKKFEIKFSEEVQGFDKDDVTVNGLAVKSATQDKTDKTKYIVELNSAVSGLSTVAVRGTEGSPAVASYADLSGEAGKAFSQIVNFAADTVKPTATAAISVNKDGNQVLTFTTSEDTTVIAGTTITLPAKAVKNYVTTSGNITFAASDLKAVTGSSTQYTVELSKVKFAGSALVKDTVYTVDLAADVFADVAGNKNEAKTAAFSFTRGADKDATKPSVVSVSDDNLDTFTVDFGTAVELDNATVVNKANYYVAGATIESVSLDATGKATVKLVSGSNNYSGKRTVKVTGIKAANGNVIEDYTATKNFFENVKPTVQSAKVANIVKATGAVDAKAATTSAVTASNAAAGTLTVTGTYTGTTDKAITVTKTATGYSIDGTNDVTLSGTTFATDGLTFETSGLTAPQTGDTWTVNATAAVAAVPANAGTTTVKVTLSEEVNATNGTEYVVNIGGKAVTAKATVTGATNAKDVTLTINKELTAEDFANGVTLTSDDYKIVDGAGNKADIPAAGIKVSL